MSYEKSICQDYILVDVSDNNKRYYRASIQPTQAPVPNEKIFYNKPRYRHNDSYKEVDGMFIGTHPYLFDARRGTVLPLSEPHLESSSIAPDGSLYKPYENESRIGVKKDYSEFKVGSDAYYKNPATNDVYNSVLFSNPSLVRHIMYRDAMNQEYPLFIRDPAPPTTGNHFLRMSTAFREYMMPQLMTKSNAVHYNFRSL